MSPPHRKFPKALKNCAEVIELGKDAISYCLVRRAPRQTLAAPSRSHLIAQRRAVWDHTKCTSGRQPCPRAAVASRSFARSRRRRAERVRSGDDDVASGGGAQIVHRHRGATAARGQGWRPEVHGWGWVWSHTALRLAMKCDRRGGGECLARGATYQAVADRILPELDHLGAVLERLGKLAMGGRHGLSRPRRCAPRSASGWDGGGGDNKSTTSIFAGS